MYSMKSSPFKPQGAEAGLRDALRKLGYDLPLDDALKAYKQSMGLPVLNVKTPQNSPELQRMSMYADPVYRSRDVYQSDFSTFFWLKTVRGVVVINLVNDEGNYYATISVAATGEVHSELHDLQSAISSHVPGLANWEIVTEPNDKFAQLRQDLCVPSFTPDEFRLAKELLDRDVLVALQTIKYSGDGMLRRDLPRKLSSQAEADDIADRLLQLGLVKSEYVVFCTKRQTESNRAPDKSTIELMGQRGVKCGCGKLVSEERIEEILAATDLAGQLLNGSRWMTIMLVRHLLDAGIPLEDTLVNVKDGPEEIDAFVNCCGRLLMFELKDSQFSMGHAYAFGGRVALYTPAKGIIWASGGVAPEAKTHFKKVKPAAQLHYIETIADAESGIKDMVDAVRWQAARRLLAPLATATTMQFDVSAGILEVMRKPTQDGVRTANEQAAPSAINPPESNDA